jgi:hypothetical protein
LLREVPSGIVLGIEELLLTMAMFFALLPGLYGLIGS